jgi:hypothetical protein
MRQHLHAVEDVAAMIRRGDGLLLAGDEALLRRLPRGRWIGGTIPYFMTEAGGRVDRDHVFVTPLPAGLACAAVRRYGEDDIGRVYADVPASAFAVLIVPAASRVHLGFALGAPNYDRFATRPLIGWVSGVHLSELGARTPKVFDGTTGEALEQSAVVMHVSLPPGHSADLGVVNLFEEGDGPVITFPESGFTVTAADVGGERRNLADYVREQGLDTRLPLVADYCGTRINVSFQATDPERREVRFYAPVFAGVPYRLARPIGDYVAEFRARAPANPETIAFSCNCILNFLYSNLEGAKTGPIACPITFGEIAYQLLNQTMAYVRVEATR